MAIHWVNYDLNKAGQDYAGLIDYLKSHQSWAKPMKSSFFVKTTLSAGELRDGAKTQLDTTDDIIVIPVAGQGWSSYGISKNVTDWMKANL